MCVCVCVRVRSLPMLVHRLFVDDVYRYHIVPRLLRAEKVYRIVNRYITLSRYGYLKAAVARVCRRKIDYLSMDNV